MSAQTEETVLKLAQSQTVRIVATSINKDGKEFKDFGKGIVLNGEFLATCYHLISPPDSFKLSTIELIYNEQTVDGKFSFDSMLLKKDFEPTAKQYNFSKHVFIRGKYSTDVVVLQLLKKLEPINHYNFYRTAPQLLEKTYSLGSVLQDNIVNPAFQAGLYVFTYTDDDSTPYFACVVPYTVGFSGGPLYNTAGEVLGMIQFSMEVFPSEFLKGLISKGIINEGFYKGIEEDYKKGRKLQFAIDINFLIDKYLQGYL